MMYPVTYLEWFRDGEWRRIGWPATFEESAAALRKHGARLAAHGGRYRLVVPSIFADQPPEVVHEYPVNGAAA